MNVGAATAGEWAGYVDDAFEFGEFPAGSLVLDIGFGTGGQMRRVQARGCRSIGVEVDAQLARKARAAGLTVLRAAAEALPFRTGRFDGVVCKVVVPYTDEARAIAEVARMLRPGAVARLSYHGLGYFLRYLLTDLNWRRRVYGARTILNTAWYAVTGRRLPGFWGDTLYQSERRLRRYYARDGLELLEAPPPARFAGAPVFIYHVVRRRVPPEC